MDAFFQVVDVNENLYAPYFNDFAVRGTVKENSRVGTSVLTVSAKDDDKGRDGVLRYSIKGGNGLGTFTIDEDTGVITFAHENACLPCNISFHIANLYILSPNFYSLLFLNFCSNCCIVGDTSRNKKAMITYIVFRC